jgi:hypothetical protein
VVKNVVKDTGLTLNIKVTIITDFIDFLGDCSSSLLSCLAEKAATS